MNDSATVERLSKAIGQATKSAKFCVAGSLPVVDPDIEVEGVGTITLPLKRKTAKELVAACRVAPFGKGTQTLVNKKVRNTFELDPKKFRLSDAWNSAIADTMQAAGVRQRRLLLGTSRQRKARPDGGQLDRRATQSV
jgi:hypothetical protein